ncbi:hypothetical protein D9M69_522250 [compost metagenome]
MCGQEVHQTALVDRNQSRFLGPPGRCVVALERGQKVQQHLVVVLVALVLAAVVVDQVALALQAQLAAVCQITIDGPASGFNLFLKPLQEGGFAVTGVARNQHEPELPLQHSGQQGSVQRGVHIGREPKRVHAPRTGIAAAALAVERQQV